MPHPTRNRRNDDGWQVKRAMSGGGTTDAINRVPTFLGAKALYTQGAKSAELEPEWMYGPASARPLLLPHYFVKDHYRVRCP